ncbi:methyltransferase [Marinifilum fragile]|uniref:methyltransferase n=1 Tax=Marinifilum fragile TaxID=570161 RepID=UPI0006D220B6|nr:methyltransferase [Marinifilum fragile]
MLLNKNTREQLNDLFYIIRLQDRYGNASLDKKVKIEQVLAFLEIMHADIKKISKKKKLVFIDSAAGNCYLSFLIYFFYQKIDERDIEIHCVDINERLMAENRELAKRMNFDRMHFHANDISQFTFDGNVDAVYSLHACDTATDKTMHLAIRNNARFIFSVACCQHSITMRSKTFKSVIRHKAFRDKTIMMISDSLRAMLLELMGFKVSIFDFVSSRFTEKNTMLRATRTDFRKTFDIADEYKKVSEEFKMKPYLEELLKEELQWVE